MLSEFAMDRDLDGELEWYQTILSSNLFFKVPAINVYHILDAMTRIEVSEGETVIHEGDEGDCCYFLLEGEADILKSSDNGALRCVAKISSGRCFGEDALLELRRRNASVKMTSEGVLMRLEKIDFLTLLQEPAIDELDCSEVDALSEKPIWVDVRTNLEYSDSHLAYSANVPLSNLSLKRRLLSPDQCYVLYCDTGRRSRAAAYFLGKDGFNVVSLDGGLQKQGMVDNLVKDSGYLLRDGKLVAPKD
jgi:rhodanese-related sulfurtransferase